MCCDDKPDAHHRDSDLLAYKTTRNSHVTAGVQFFLHTICHMEGHLIHQGSRFSIVSSGKGAKLCSSCMLQSFSREPKHRLDDFFLRLHDSVYSHWLNWPVVFVVNQARDALKAHLVMCQHCENAQLRMLQSTVTFPKVSVYGLKNKLCTPFLKHL